jgi:hypothetical protein
MKKLLPILALSVALSANYAHAEKKAATPKKVEEKVEEAFAPQDASSTLLNQTSFFDNKISITYPAAFKPLPENYIENRYTDPANRPKFVFAPADDFTVNLALNMTPNPNGDRESIIKFFRDIKNGLRAQYPNDVEFMKNDVDNKAQTAVIEFIMPNSQKEKFYNLMFFAYVDSEFFFLNFSCPKSEIDKWQKTAWSIVDSFKKN